MTSISYGLATTIVVYSVGLRILCHILIIAQPRNFISYSDYGPVKYYLVTFSEWCVEHLIGENDIWSLVAKEAEKFMAAFVDITVPVDGLTLYSNTVRHLKGVK